ncbi:CLUMA_CG020160, isoform A [Clunio marinus]|uniref:Signal recognition particle receptor subunit beta n=1 Tax=Clunio marinus TaxID=568069 RepID=A0A1J1J5X0_9DIPT|nr:CLUMA_CG020160, isoform A [Clunio marinus]
MDQETVKKEQMMDDEFGNTSILLAALIIFITFVMIFFIKRQKAKRNDIVLTGTSESGKTLLYSLIISGKEIDSFTTIKENIGMLTLKSKIYQLVDLPGHEKLRLRLLDSYKATSKALIFVIDSSTIQKEIKDVADFLYAILADKALSNIPILILGNKQDETMSKGKYIIEQMLEKEINLIRTTKTNQLKFEGSQETMKFLGRRDMDFKFSHISQTIAFAESSAKNNNIEELIYFLNSI